MKAMDEAGDLLPAKRRPKRMKRLAIALGSVAVIFLCVLIWHHLAGWEYTDDAQVDVHLVTALTQCEFGT